MTSQQLRAYDLPAGSMVPKVSSACRFAERMGKRAAIGSLASTGDVIDGTAGTQIRNA